MYGCQWMCSLVLIMATTAIVSAQDLSVYDQMDYSGGYAEGSYGPLGDEQLYPYDSQDQWQHGYIQYMPFYGAYKHFRPYNYKHVSAQTQTAAGWGMSPRLPYSQQFWHRYHSHAKMGHPASGAYESYLDIPVPQRIMPEEYRSDVNIPERAPMPQSPAVQPPLQQSRPLQLAPQPAPAPLPYNGPGLTAPHNPNAVYYQPGELQPFSGISYQAPQAFVYQPAQSNHQGQYQPAVGYGQPTYSAPYQPAAQQPMLMVP